MKIINIKSSSSKENLMSRISDDEWVNAGVMFDQKLGKPKMHCKVKTNRVKIKCEMIGGKNKDNGFLEGTCFIGRIKEEQGGTSVKGIILTAPIYHAILFAFMIFYVYRCISIGGFNPIPPILFIFSIFMFKSEFAKQGIIERYIKRAVRKSDGEIK